MMIVEMARPCFFFFSRSPWEQAAAGVLSRFSMIHNIQQRNPNAVMIFNQVLQQKPHEPLRTVGAEF